LPTLSLMRKRAKRVPASRVVRMKLFTMTAPNSAAIPAVRYGISSPLTTLPKPEPNAMIQPFLSAVAK
jgi:hypothetical protein